MKARHLKIFDYAKLFKSRNMLIFAICVGVAICFSSIGIALAENLDSAESFASNTEDYSEEKPIINDLYSRYIEISSNTSESSQFSVKLQKVGNPKDIQLFYECDGKYVEPRKWENVEEPITPFQEIRINGYNPDGFNVDSNNYYQFIIEGSAEVSISGDFTSLIDNTDNFVNELPNYAFYNLFYHVENLSSAQESSINTNKIGESSCENMFFWCPNLKSSPDMSNVNEILSNGCSCMFRDCVVLISPPNLINLSSIEKEGCMSMFDSCFELKDPPNMLSVSLLEDSACVHMFAYCRQLLRSPDMPNIQIAKSWCFGTMFLGCHSLGYIYINVLSWDNTFTSWVQDIPKTGTFVRPYGLEEIYGEDYIPEGWKVVEEEAFTFTAKEGGTQIYYSNPPRTTNLPKYEFYTSKNNNVWKKTEIHSTIDPVVLVELNAGEKFRIYGNNRQGLNDEIRTLTFTSNNKIIASGNLSSLIYMGCDYIPNKYCYKNLFKGFDKLDFEAEDLPKINTRNFQEGCFEGMFEGCHSLSHAPILPDNSLQKNCFASMFKDCLSLREAPKLSATDLQDGCYMRMFDGCTNLASIEVGFSDWKDDASKNPAFENAPTFNWLANTQNENDEKFFYCSAELDTSVQDPSHVPEGWTIKKDGIINAEVTGVEKIYDGNAYSISVNITTPGEGFVIKYIYDGAETDTNPSFTNVGTYTVGVKITKENYQPFESSADVVINKNTSGQMTIGNYTKTYGTDDPKFEASFTGFADGFTPVEGEDFVVFRDPGENVNAQNATYSIHCIWINNNSNYDVAPATGSFTITKANAKIVADEKSMEKDEAEPNFTAHAQGLAETKDALDEADYVVTKQENDADTITLVPSLTESGQAKFLGNYNIAFENATLKSYKMGEKIIYVPEYIYETVYEKVFVEGPGKTSEVIKEVEKNDKSLGAVTSPNAGSKNATNDEVGETPNFALIASLIVNGLLIAAGIVFFLKFRSRIFK